MLEPIPRRLAECICLAPPQPSSTFPIIRSGRLSRFFPRIRFSTGRLTRLQLFRYVQASQFARLPDRSYRCKFPYKAAEAFTSEQKVRRCLGTHRTCYPPDYRQLAERGSPRKTRSLVGCSRMMPTFPRSPYHRPLLAKWLPVLARSERQSCPGLIIATLGAPTKSSYSTAAKPSQGECATGRMCTVQFHWKRARLIASAIA
jgi:hypothetical protein